MQKLTVTKIKNFKEIPSNAIIITFSDHYEGNSGDNIYFTDNKGLINGSLPSYFHWHETMDDRGIITMWSIKSNDGGLMTFSRFKNICTSYVEASNNLKDWNNGKMIYNVSGFKDTTVGNCGSQNALFSGLKSGMKKNNINKVTEILEQNKAKASAFFEENNISVRVAYNFLNGYYA